VKLQQVELERSDHIRAMAWVPVNLHPKKGRLYSDKLGNVWMVLDVYDQVVEYDDLNVSSWKKCFPSLK
jgi:hypothetical protein